MGAQTRKSGFTLVETMTASFILLLITGATYSAFLGGQRLLRMTMARTEMSLRARELRDKLLFHAAPSHDGVVWAGLLSGTNETPIVSNGNDDRILLYTEALKGNINYLGGTSSQQMDIRIGDPNAPTRHLVRGDQHDDNRETPWLRPGNLNLFAGNDTARNPVLLSNESLLTVSNRFFINIAGRINVGGNIVEHNERIVVPLFGRTQPSETSRGGGL